MADLDKKNVEKEEEVYDLNDDRRVKVLSPGALVAKRFFRNRTAVFGLTVLILMFLFSFVGGVISPYKEDQLFYRIDSVNKDFAGVKQNTELRYISNGDEFNTVVQAQALLANQKGQTEFDYRDIHYTIEKDSDNFFTVLVDGRVVGAAYKTIISTNDSSIKLSFDEEYNLLKTYESGENEVTVGSDKYVIDADGAVSKNGEDYAFISEYIVNPIMSDVVLTKQWKEELIETIEANEKKFVFTDDDGVEYSYEIDYDATSKIWTIKQKRDQKVYDRYSPPSDKHWLGTDRNGMDMLTRLMYGGRVSLIIGFIVEIIASVLGVIMGGISGYFGKWVDNLIMRIVDIFYCIPSTPILIIIGAAMDAMRIDSKIRMIYLMLILGFLGWPGIARMVRGLILSLREQEFMTATEATGISVSRRIFKHLVPNVIPQLIVSVTMGLGSTILTEATLSFLGLGVRFPFASWGNIINDVNDKYVLTNYWFVWIPAGICLLTTVLAFNLVGDGLRDAFDPRMKR